MKVLTSTHSEDQNNSCKISLPPSPFETPSLSRVATKGLVFRPFFHGLDKRWQNDYLSGAFLTVPTDSDVAFTFFRCIHRSEHAADSCLECGWFPSALTGDIGSLSVVRADATTMLSPLKQITYVRLSGDLCSPPDDSVWHQ